MEEKNIQPEKISSSEPGTEVEALQKRVEELESRLKERLPAAPEQQEKIARQEIKGYLKELQKISSTASPLATRDEVKEIKRFPASQQVGVLVSLAFEKGIEKAITIAKGLNNPAILDEFHDILIDQHYDSLVKKGIIKPK